jgi:hypothetical protein
MVCRYVLCLTLGAAVQVGPTQEQKPLGRQDAPALSSPPRSATWARSREDADSSKFFCRSEALNTTWAIANPPLAIDQSRIEFTETGTSYIDLRARNVEASPVEALALVIEYADKLGQVLERVPVAAATEQASEQFRPPFPLQHTNGPWTKPLLPGDSVRVQGIRDGVRTASCADSARVTFAMVQFGDGTTKTFSSAGWQLGPTPQVIPVVPAFPSDLVEAPIALLARVKISASGQILDVIPLDQEQSPALNLIRDQMRQDWKFNPALYDGRPTTSDLIVLFRIHSERTLAFSETRPSPSPLILIDFFPDERNPGKLLIAYGRLFSGSGVK